MNIIQCFAKKDYFYSSGIKIKRGVTLVMFTCGFISSFAQNSKTPHPNVIYIYADDLGYGDIKALNPDAQVATPNLDKLFSQSLSFSDAHSPSAVCTPSRYGVMTGQYCFRSSLKSGVLSGYSKSLIEPDHFTIADLMKNAGYQTAIIGKWHLGLDWALKDNSKPQTVDLPHWRGTYDNIDFSKPLKSGVNELGFDYSYILSASLDLGPYTFIENGLVTSKKFRHLEASKKPRGNVWAEGLIGVDFELENILDCFVDKAKSYLNKEAQQSKPFFLYLPLTSPHMPWLPSSKFRGSSGAGTYGDFVENTDDAVGRILATLDSLNLSDNTIVVFSSDNGADWKPGDKTKYPKHSANYIYRGAKSDVWDGGHRIPFFVRWPRIIKQGAVTDQLLCQTDIMATLAKIVGQKLPKNAAPDSFDFSNLIFDSTYKKPVRETIIHHSIDGVFAIRNGKWKFIDSNGSGGYAMNFEKPYETSGQLYDMLKDPGETTNLFSQYPKVVNDLKALLEKQKNIGHTR